MKMLNIKKKYIYDDKLIVSLLDTKTYNFNDLRGETDTNDLYRSNIW